MLCDKCIHKHVCHFRWEGKISEFERLNNCCCYVEVDNPDEFMIRGDSDFVATQPVIKAIKCQHPTGNMSMKIHGEMFDVDPCIYEEIERHEGVTVIISKCKSCGHIDISWQRGGND